MIPNNYSSSKVQEKYKLRKTNCEWKNKIIKNSFIAIFIENLIREEKYTPKQIGGRYKKGIGISFKTIYRTIDIIELKNNLPKKIIYNLKVYIKNILKINNKIPYEVFWDDTYIIVVFN